MFSNQQLREAPGTTPDSDRFRSVEHAVMFRRLHCYACDLTAVYKYRVKQIRRTPELLAPEGSEPTEDDWARWRAIPRYAEIPETVPCKGCGEVLGLCTECIY